MTHQNFSKTLSTFKIIVLALALSVGLSYVSADWSAPPSTPPTCPTSNPACNTPINVGSTAQAKTGMLTVAGLTINNHDYTASGYPFWAVLAPGGLDSNNTTYQVNSSGALFLNSNYMGNYNNAKTGWRWYVLDNGNTYQAGTATIAGGSPAAGKVLTATDSTGLSSWQTPSAGGFGVWNDRTKDGVADSVAFNTSYQAQTDGLIMAHITYASWPEISCYRSSDNVNWTLVVYTGPNDDGGAHVSLTCPARKGDYWKMTQTGVTGLNGISWLPIGN